MSIKKVIDLNDLPRNNNGNINWKDSIGKTIDFIYDDISGTLLIVGYNKGRVTIEYNGRQKEMASGHLRNLKIADLVGYRIYDFIYDIGQTLCNKDGKEAVVLDKVRIKGDRYYLMKCSNCGEEFYKLESEMSDRGSGWCPVCCNKTHKRVKVGVNDMWTTDPDLAEQLLDPNDGYKYVTGTNTKLRWKCKYCGEPHDVKAIPKTIIGLNRTVSCHSCGDGISYPNKFLFNLLKKCRVNFKPEQVFPWSNGRRYDFNLIDNHIICEVHGMQHYDGFRFGIRGRFIGSIRDDKKIDKEKYELALENGYAPEEYVVIDARDSDPAFIMNNVLNSHLADVIDFSSIDLAEIEKMCSISIFDEVIKGVNEGKNAYQIAEETNFADITIYRYIKRGESLGILKYDRDKFNLQRLDNLTKTNRQRDGIPILCVDTGDMFMTSGILDETSQDVFGERMVRSCVTDAINKDKQYKDHEWAFVTRKEFNDYKMKYPDKAFGDFFDLERYPDKEIAV